MREFIQEINRAVRFESGFTFVELMLVAVLISILASITALNFSAVQEQTTRDLVKADLKIIRAALRSYYLENGTYPDTLQELVQNDGAGFLEDVPDDKFVPGVKYSYQKIGETYALWSWGPNRQNDNCGGDDITPDTP